MINKAFDMIYRVVKRRLAAREIAQRNGTDDGDRSLDAPTTFAVDQKKHLRTFRTQALSLLWPPEASGKRKSLGFQLSIQTQRDLDIGGLLANLEPERKNQADIDSIMSFSVTDADTLNYRLDVLEDLLKSPPLISAFETIAPILTQMSELRIPGGENKAGLFDVAWRLGELENYIDALEILRKAFQNLSTSIVSTALIRLRQEIDDVFNNELFKSLVCEAPGMLKRIRSARSMTIGVNLTPQMMPESATILSVQPTRFRESSLLKTLFKKSVADGISPLHSLMAKQNGQFRPLMTPLFRDLSDILSIVSRQISKALVEYAQIDTLHLASLKAEILFYIAMAKSIRRIQNAGLPMCRPIFSEGNQRRCRAKDAVNINLAFKMMRPGNHNNLSETLVKSDIDLGDDGRILILTGPNQGGKSVYTQAVGLVQVLAQIGMYVPAEKAAISVAQGIFTHFPNEEKINQGTGRLGDEAKRLNEIMEQVSENSLVLLNESLSSTSFGESLYIAEDLMKALSILGCRMIFATHLHELADRIDEINAEIGGRSLLRSIVALAEELPKDLTNGGELVKRLYKIAPGPPRGQSYALEIARKYDISFQQIMAKLEARGLLDPNNQDGGI